MSRPKRSQWRRRDGRLCAALSLLWQALCRRWQGFCRRCRQVQIEVLVADKTRRRSLEWELRTGLRQMQRVLGAPLPAELAVVVQQVIQTDHQLAGCYQVGKRPDGSRFALVRLALQVNDRRLDVNELLAVLADQCIGLATQQGGGSVLVPVELGVSPPDDVQRTRLTTFKPDPLAPHANGAGAAQSII